MTSPDKPTDKPLSGFVAKLTAMRGAQGSLEVYEPWAQSYEEELISEYGYIAPRIAADAFAQASAELDGPVIDFGCGTGLVGVELAQRGYQHIDGIDISPAMLEQAKAKGAYRQLLQADLSVRTTIADNAYASAIAVGCFGSGHLGLNISASSSARCAAVASSCCTPMASPTLKTTIPHIYKPSRQRAGGR